MKKLRLLSLLMFPLVMQCTKTPSSEARNIQEIKNFWTELIESATPKENNIVEIENYKKEAYYRLNYYLSIERTKMDEKSRRSCIENILTIINKLRNLTIENQ